MRGEVSTGTFCLEVLGAGALRSLCLQFPKRWGRLSVFSWLQDSTNVLSQWAGHTYKQRCDIIYFSFRKAPFSMLNNNSWYLIFLSVKRNCLSWFIDSAKYAVYTPQQWVQNFSYWKNNAEYWMKAKTFRFPEETILWYFLVLIKSKVFWGMLF